ncbi:MAG: hypothetical protein IKV54_04545 [Clostridia bacterium]|nr:hypothetical protein [Clostridia bacterium]
MNKIYRNILSVIAVILTVSSLFACGPATIEVTDEEIREVLKELLPKAEEINEIYYGDGLPTREAAEGAVYLELSPDAKYKTPEELKAATFAVFSDDLAGQMFTIGVQGVYDDESDELGVDRGLDSRYTNMLGIFCMRASKKEPLFDIGRNYDIDSATVTHRGSKYIEVTIMSEKDGEQLELTLTLLPADSQKTQVSHTTEELLDPAETTAAEELTVADAGYWRLDTPTY